eukprot:Gb_37214 [translate_table: standard]
MTPRCSQWTFPPLLCSGVVTVDSSRGLLGSELSSSFVNFWMGFDEKPRGLLQLILLVQESAKLALTGALSVSIYLVTGLQFTSRISVFAFVGLGGSKGCVLSYLVFEVLVSFSLHLPCARREYFCVGSMVLGSLLSAWSHSFCQRANLSALVSSFYGSSYPLGGIGRPPGCGWFSYKPPSLPQPGSSRYEPSHPFAS